MFKLLCLLWLVSGILNAREFVFSYRLAIKDGVVLNEDYYFSPVMQERKSRLSPYKNCEILHEAKSEKEFLKNYKEEILECFFKWGIKLEDRSKATNLVGNFVSVLSIPPTRIYIEFERGIAKIYYLHPKKEKK
ncbi:hypothetical protein [Helicobacter burdigaliensis]|uniref:hypothetical protein n=1 Tax=Helicobacter burdigaliensis TaxID=2315334 RepID=UPI000EF71367|nr:hypothetical protein [Helicobacter burdigaliensis]